MRAQDRQVQDQHRVVAIDGPAASGKSSVARDLARRLGFVYVNSGAMYRAATWHVLQHNVDPADAERVVQLVESAPITCDLQNNESRILIDDVDPADRLRDDRVNNDVSLVSRLPRVREILVAKMRNYAREHDVVMEGRDIGSAVFPDTPYKFYIDASPEVRSQRRALQGELDAVAARDHADSSRHASPLVIAKDAEFIDTSHLTIAGVVDEIIRRLKVKGLPI
jgi:cytidylate kinase